MIETTVTRTRPGNMAPGGNGFGAPGDAFHRDTRERPLPQSACRLGMWLGLASIGMLFFALTSAYVVRLGLDPGWQAIRMPPFLLANTLVLLASSFTLEKARRAGSPTRDVWIAVTLGLGLLFLAGQLAAWRQLSGAGVLLSTNAHGSFFYLLTGLHGLHLAGGLAALGYLTVMAWSRRMVLAQAGGGWDSAVYPRMERWLEGTSLYWHFMDGLWLYVFVLLFSWK